MGSRGAQRAHGLGMGFWLRLAAISSRRTPADRLRCQTPSISTSQQALPLASVPTRNSEPMPQNSWMIPQLTLSAELDRERGRRLIREMSPERLAAHADSLWVAYLNQSTILRQATRRIAELEAREAIKDPAPRHHQWAREVLSRLGLG